MSQTQTTAAAPLAELGKLGTAYVSASQQTIKLASDLLGKQDGDRKTALKKVAAIREHLAKAKLIEPGQEKQADEILSQHDGALDVLGNVLEAYIKLSTKNAENTEKTSSLGQGVDSVSGNGQPEAEKRGGRMVLQERRPRGHSEADTRLRDALLR